ncbi:MAG: putative flap endonuclease-1-like 5' DNA nuclease [Polaribacter sp.]|jgi:predicted flap endonuclease-1-like 5' DNA nuclease
MTLDKLKEFFTQLFTALSVEDSLYIIGFLFISWLLGLLFGRWSRSGKIRQLKRELQAKDKDLIMLRAENGSYKEQLEMKEEAIQRTQQELEETQVRTRQLEEENSHLSADLENNKQVASSISAENTSNIERVDELHKLVADLQYKNDELTALADRGTFQSDDVEHLQDTFELTTNRINALEVKLSRMEAENQNLHAELGTNSGTHSSSGSSLDSGIIAIKSRLEQLERENNRLQKTLSTIQIAQADLGTSKPKQPVVGDEVSMEERTASARSAINSAIGSKIKSATVGEKNDLKKINGIGPFIEKKLNDIGIFTYQQISQFDADLILQITAAIQFFPGRINRDDWVGQAKKLIA